MGFRFSLKHANWLAHILQPFGTVPDLGDDFSARESLQALLRSAEANFYGSQENRVHLARLLKRSEAILHGGGNMTQAAGVLREFFREACWIALLIPSGNREFDSFFSSREFLRDLVSIRPGDPGLILQIDEALDDQNRVELDNVFPAFRVALAHATRWPGVLVWTPGGDAAFFEVSRRTRSAREQLNWLFSHLAVSYGSPDLSLLRQQFIRENDHVGGEVPPLRILHLSDVHLGSREAQRRLPRVKQLISLAAEELGDHLPLVPVVTGDLMDTPDEAHLDAVRDFIEFLHGIGSEEPVVILGNHDVRRDGWLNQDLQSAMRIKTDRVRWFDRSRVGLACFNSVRGGQLARGQIDETEMMDVGLALDRESAKLCVRRTTPPSSNPG